MHIPLQRFTAVLDQVKALRTSFRREIEERTAAINSHRNTLARVNVLLTHLRSSSYTLYQAAVRGSELERQCGSLRNTIECMFQDLSSSGTDTVGEESSEMPNEADARDAYFTAPVREPLPSQHA